MTKKTTRTRAEAKKMMWEYYRDNKGALPKWISEFREEILARLLSGLAPSIAFKVGPQTTKFDTPLIG
jgi:hypothetical protein